MNTMPTPAYLVHYQSGNDQPTRRFFAHANLLTARKAAFTFVESLFTNRLEDYLAQDELELSLVEIAVPDDPAPTVIAQLMRTIKADPDSEANRQDGENRLLALHREFTYYQARHHSIGFGAFGLSLNRLQTPATMERLTVLSEAMGSVMALIGSYNSGWTTQLTFDYYHPDDPIEIRHLS